MLAVLILSALALPATLGCAYLGLLTLLSWKAPPPPRSLRQVRFDVIVPAHNEQDGIARTVTSLLGIDWPADRFRVVVIADNCQDETAATARSAGALVLERQDSTLRGKGYALQHAFNWSAQDGFATAVVVVDADSEVSSNLLESFAIRIERGEQAIQAHYGIRNPHASWRTQLMTIAMGAFHIVRSRGRERLRLSCGIRGNGWCVTHALLRQVPYNYFSLAEDIEFGIELGIAGHRVAYADEASANADMASRAEAAQSQRQRWERGRYQLVRSRTLPLLWLALRRASAVCLDLALDLIVPPLSYIALNVFLFAALATVFTGGGAVPVFWDWWAAACALVLVVYVLRGWQVSGMGLRGLAALTHVPTFIFWRLKVMAVGKSSEWIRTERE